MRRRFWALSLPAILLMGMAIWVLSLPVMFLGPVTKGSHNFIWTLKWIFLRILHLLAWKRSEIPFNNLLSTYRYAIQPFEWKSDLLRQNLILLITRLSSFESPLLLVNSKCGLHYDLLAGVIQASGYTREFCRILMLHEIMKRIACWCSARRVGN